MVAATAGQPFPLPFFFLLLHLSSLLSTVHVVCEQWRALFMAGPIMAQPNIWAQPSPKKNNWVGFDPIQFFFSQKCF
jgi:hypothetical protein